VNAPPHESAVIVGAGPIGLACAISARRRGLDPLVIDAGAVANSIVRYPIGMVFFTTPERLEIGGHPLVCAGAKPTREEALKYYRGVARAEALRVRPTPASCPAAQRNANRIAELATGSARRTHLRPSRTGDWVLRSSQPARRAGEELAHESLLRRGASQLRTERGGDRGRTPP
jgi:hypothetical protein